MKLSEEKIAQIGAYFSDKPVLKAFLFGSQLSGLATADSDVDILVELDYSERIGLLFVQMQFELEDLLEQKVDLVSSNALSEYIKPIVDNEKQLIYAR